MGKSKPNRSRKQVRDNPTGVSAEVESEEVVVECGDFNPYNKNGLSSETLKSISKQLQSSVSDERSTACHALVGLIRNSEDSFSALHEGLIKIIGPLLLDSSSTVCHSAAAALHILTLKGGDQAVKLAIEHDILTPLIALLKKIPSNWKPLQTPANKMNTSEATFIETVRALNVLAEGSAAAVDRIQRENLVEMLVGFLDVKVYGSDLVDSVAQMLATVTEDQGDAAGYADVLRKAITEKLLCDTECSHLLKNLSLIILLNLNNQQINSELGFSLKEVIDILNSSLRLDHRKAASTVVDHLPVFEDEDVSNAMEVTSLESKLDDAIETAEHLLLTQMKALEILTNLCCSGDDSDFEDYDNESSSEFSLNGEGLEEISVNLHPELKKALIDGGFFQLIIEKAKLPATNIVEALSQHRLGKSLLRQYEALQSLAFLCVNNMVVAFDVEEIGGSKELFDIWCGLAILTFQGDKADQGLASATASMRAIIRKLSSHKDIVNLLKLEDISILCQRVLECNQPQSKVNLLQVLGTLGSMAAGNEPPLLEPRSLILRGIGQVLLDIACLETDLWIASEAIDALFDVFKEDHTDPVIGEIQLVERLKTLVSGFKPRVNSSRRSLPADHLPVIMTVKDNLPRFIKYKTKRTLKSC